MSHYHFRIRIVSVFLFVFFHFCSLFSQDTIQIKTFYDDTNKQPKELYQSIITKGDTIKQGLYTFYYENGQKWQEGNFYNNELDGNWKIYTYTGLVKKIISFRENLKNGFSSFYDESGLITDSSYYVNDTLNGLSFEFHKGKNTIHYKRQYKNNVQNGIWEKYFDNGNLNYIGKKNKDTFVDSLLVYYSNGSLKRRCYYKEGKLHGTFVSYYSISDSLLVLNPKSNTGEIMINCNYTNGDINGMYTEYYITGTIKEKGLYKNNLRTDHWISWYPNERIYTTGNYLENKLSGEWLVYYPNGKIKQTGKYVKSLAYGKWHFFHPNGSLMLSGLSIENKRVGIWHLFYKNKEINARVMYSNGLPKGMSWIYENGIVVEKKLY